MRILLVALATGCMSATYHGQTTGPIADRAVVLAGGAPVGDHIGTIEASGSTTTSVADLGDRAAVIAALHGGTHVALTGAGEAVTTSTQPATSSETCTHDDTTNTDNCTTTYTPETTTTIVTPYASYDVFRVPADRWSELPDALRPLAYDPSHHVPSAADGSGVTFGAFSTPAPGADSGTSGDVFPTSYTRSPAQLGGLWIASSLLYGSTELAFDLRFGGGGYDGMAANTAQRTQAVHYTGTYIGSGLAVRLGKRVAWDDLALAAGAGLGGALWDGITTVDHSAPVEASFVEPPDGGSADLYVPVWTSLTVKPSCSWGVQGLAEYDVRPLDGATSAPSLSLGVIWQPASACR